MRSASLVLLAVAIVFGSWAPAAAGTIVNGSFETGGFAGWIAVGDSTVQTAAFGITPTDGAFMGLFTTLGTGFDEVPFGQPAPLLFPFLQNVLGFTDRELFSVSDQLLPFGSGSVIRQEFSGQSGDRLLLDYFYLTTDPCCDRGFVALVPEAGGPKSVTFLDLVFEQLQPSPVELCPEHVGPGPCPPGFTRTNGWQHAAITLPSSGSFTLALGMWEGADTLGGSAILIDNFRVPGAAGWLAMFIGIAAGAWALAGRRRGRLTAGR